MAGSLNKVILIGNLGRDPELKASTNGQSLARFSVATTETWKDANGAKQSRTEWHNVVVWGKQADTAGRYLHKGDSVCVEGRIQYREYNDQSGNKKLAVDIRCDNFQMLGSKGDGSSHGDASSGSRGAQAQDDMPPPPQGGFDDDIPF